jgi:hypothetical protein
MYFLADACGECLDGFPNIVLFAVRLTGGEWSEGRFPESDAKENPLTDDLPCRNSFME